MGGQIKRALISVHDKPGVVAFARSLVGEFGIEILSTGGTAKLLADQGVAVTLVEDVIGSGEMLDGRVKTLHPRIHAGILADRDNADHMRQLGASGIAPIDLVVVNLYPFARVTADPACTMEDAIEQIDVGGPCMLRAAAKNWRHVTAVHQPELYEEVLGRLRRGGGSVDDAFRMTQAAAVFQLTSRYDGMIEAYLSRHEGKSTGVGRRSSIVIRHAGDLRYGENPHQRASLWGVESVDGADVRRGPADAPMLIGARQVGGGAISFNNYCDADAALGLCAELTRGLSGGCCVFVKHLNACGAGIADEPMEAYRRAYLGDPNAAMGGVLACSFAVNANVARTVVETYDRWGRGAGAGGFFFEVWIAPKFEDEAIRIVQGSKSWGGKARLLETGTELKTPDTESMSITGIRGGLLLQTRDSIGLDEQGWKVVTKRKPTEMEWSDLRTAQLVCKHTKSNAISICRDGMLIGNGAGQMSRVMSCRIATWSAKENGHAEQLAGASAASDAFFPFSDGPVQLMEAGVTAIIQPGGSKRDEVVVAACDARGCSMVMTGVRHFKH